MMRLRTYGQGLGIYLAIPTALALLGGLWFGMSLRETPEEQLLVERLDALAAQSQILSDSFLNEVERIKIEVQNRLPLNSQIRYWSSLKRQGNDIGGIEASAVLAGHTAPATIETLKQQQWELGKLIDIESIDRNGFQIFQFKNEDYAVAWSHAGSILIAWVKNFKSLMIEDRKTHLFHQSIDLIPHWTVNEARKILFEQNQKLGVSYQVSKDNTTSLSAFARVEKTPWFLVVEQLDTSGLFAAPTPIETRLGQGLAAFGVILLFGAFAARGIERKTKIKTYTADAPPPFQQTTIVAAQTEAPPHATIPAATVTPAFVFPKILTLDAGLIQEPSVSETDHENTSSSPATSLPPPPSLEAIAAAEAAQAAFVAASQAEQPAELIEPSDSGNSKAISYSAPDMGDGAEVAGPIRFQIPKPEYSDEESGKRMLSEVQAQILNLTDKNMILERICAAASKLCDSPVLYFEYRSEFKAALLANTSGFAPNKIPGAMSFPIADEAVSTISQSVRNRKIASLSNFQPLCRVLMDRTGVAYFDAWAVTSRQGDFHGVLVVLQAGVQSAMHRTALARLLSGIGLSSGHVRNRSHSLEMQS